MQLIIRLLSDLCTCSGDTHNSLVDTDVVYDENGIPYIPAKRIKGCIREVAQEIWKRRTTKFSFFSFECLHRKL